MRKTTIRMALLLVFFFLAACAAGQPGTAPAQDGPDGPEGTPAWAGLGLSGRILFIQYKVDGNTLVETNLATGQARTVFQAPDNTWLSAAMVSPDGTQIVLAYTPPVSDTRQIGYTGLYLLPIEGAGEPQPLVEVREPLETYAQPAWSPDGKYIYYGHLYPQSSEDGMFQYRIERVDLAGSVEALVEGAFWPRLSPDGSTLAFLTYDPQGITNELYVSDPLGKGARPVLEPGTFQAVDAHMFSPDGTSITFSAVNEDAPASAFREPTTSPQLRAWLQRIFGVEPARAHTAPSDWYRAAFPGGEPRRLTFLEATGLFGAFSPDGSHIAFISDQGLSLMRSDGQDLTLLEQTLAIGTIDWIP